MQQPCPAVVIHRQPSAHQQPVGILAVHPFQPGRVRFLHGCQPRIPFLRAARFIAMLAGQVAVVAPSVKLADSSAHRHAGAGRFLGQPLISTVKLLQ
ncbi:hypothetical protein [Paracoccus aminovorans]|uniref:hypothetical protein n=1 Tax=Paracoccus aminovorans TaxID=34004 RepID=UPI000783EE81|nr:hypothetical protein [Paracoccus aminovorans]